MRGQVTSLSQGGRALLHVQQIQDYAWLAVWQICFSPKLLLDFKAYVCMPLERLPVPLGHQPLGLCCSLPPLVARHKGAIIVCQPSPVFGGSIIVHCLHLIRHACIGCDSRNLYAIQSLPALLPTDVVPTACCDIWIASDWTSA